MNYTTIVFLCIETEECILTMEKCRSPILPCYDQANYDSVNVRLVKMKRAFAPEVF